MTDDDAFVEVEERPAKLKTILTIAVIVGANAGSVGEFPDIEMVVHALIPPLCLLLSFAALLGFMAQPGTQLLLILIGAAFGILSGLLVHRLPWPQNPRGIPYLAAYLVACIASLFLTPLIADWLGISICCVF